MQAPERYLPVECRRQGHGNCDRPYCGHNCCRRINPQYIQYEKDCLRKRVHGDSHGLVDSVPFLQQGDTSILKVATWIYQVVGEDERLDYAEPAMIIAARSKVQSIKKDASALAQGTVTRAEWASFCDEVLTNLEGNSDWLSDLYDSVRHPDEKGPNESVAVLWQRVSSGHDTYKYFFLLTQPNAELPPNLDKEFCKAFLSTLDMSWDEQIQISAKGSGSDLTCNYVRQLATMYERQAKARRRKRVRRNRGNDSSEEDQTDDTQSNHKVLAALTELSKEF